LGLETGREGQKITHVITFLPLPCILLHSVHLDLCCRLLRYCSIHLTSKLWLSLLISQLLCRTEFWLCVVRLHFVNAIASLCVAQESYNQTKCRLMPMRMRAIQMMVCFVSRLVVRVLVFGSAVLLFDLSSLQLSVPTWWLSMQQ
jgi:hypothetical protein